MAGSSAAALEAAAWVVNMESGRERSRLYNGHMSRRRDIMENSYRTTDHSEADAWLIEQWEAASAEDEDPCCEECVAWRTGEADDPRRT